MVLRPAVTSGVSTWSIRRRVRGVGPVFTKRHVISSCAASSMLRSIFGITAWRVGTVFSLVAGVRR